VLDIARGEPARGVRVEVFGGGELIATHQTNADGRIADLLGQPLRPGVYRLVFHPPSPFFTRVEVEVQIADADRPYHIPLLVSPYGCTTYRGS
jgi:5-hydroxyisourate hydrolase-like protein (transthyretin family)